MASAIPLLLIVEVFIETGVVVQELLEVCAGVGTGIMDGKTGSGEGAAAPVAGNDDPVLPSIAGSCAKQNWLSNLQQLVERT